MNKITYSSRGYSWITAIFEGKFFVIFGFRLDEVGWTMEIELNMMIVPWPEAYIFDWDQFGIARFYNQMAWIVSFHSV